MRFGPLFLATVLVFNTMSAVTAPLFLRKYPHGLLTEEYGILSEDDLATDAWRGDPKPFEKNGFNGGYPYWQCFLKRDARVKYSVWKDNDPMGRSDVIVNLCFFEFKVETKDANHIYIGRRAERLATCRMRMRNWKQITRTQKYVCFNGYDGSVEASDAQSRKPTQIWTWDRIKTRTGCLSYFDGLCNLKEWQKQGYSRSKN